MLNISIEIVIAFFTAIGLTIDNGISIKIKSGKSTNYWQVEKLLVREVKATSSNATMMT